MIDTRIPRRGVLLGALGLAAAGPLALAGPAPARAETEPPSDPKLQQTVSESEEIRHGEKVVIDAGHVDIGPRLVNDEWIVAARDDTAAPPVWRSLDDVVLQVHDAGALDLPDDPAYSFTGADAGQKVWSVPQTEIPGVVWVGWNTQDPPVVQTATRGVTLRVHSIQGPGKMSLFLQPGNFEPPQVLVDPKVSQPQDIFVEPNTHTHANWVFTAPGVYLVDLEVRAETPEGKTYSSSVTVRYSVGDQTDPEVARTQEWADGKGPQARAESGGAGAASDGGSDAGGAPGTEQGSGDDDGGGGGGGGNALLISGGIAAAVGGIAAAGVALQRGRSKKARDAAWEGEEGEGVRRQVAHSGETPAVGGSAAGGEPGAGGQPGVGGQPGTGGGDRPAGDTPGAGGGDHPAGDTPGADGQHGQTGESDQDGEARR